MGHLISINDLTDEDFQSIIARGADFAAGADAGHQLDGKIVGIYFAKTSTRTRTAFSAAALRLGARIITYGPGDLQTNTGETAEDTGAVLSRMLDALVVRTAGDPGELRAWTGQHRMQVVNAMTADEHPTQALADATMIRRHFGHVENLRILYVGEGNNTAAALALALTRFPGLRLELRTPPGYGLAQETLAQAHLQAGRHEAVLTERHDMTDVPGRLDVIYTTRWQTTGSTKADSDWRAVFAPFQVSGELWQENPKAVFMHDLPAHRGEEVTADVLDGPASIAFGQAENKMYSAMAVLEWCLKGPAGTRPA
ncbi:MAG TPA: ornithine carbamoyltransferase [Streptosporangiaceae bacterium]